MLVQCCVCEAVRKDGRWVKVADVNALGDSVSHGYCPKCAASAFAEIRKMHGKVELRPRTAMSA